jgi:fatty acid desaturase
MSRRREFEWPTFTLIAVDYVVLGLLVWFHASLPWWVILAVGSYAAALHVSLQHEILHGHPTGNRAVNEALVFLSPHFWLPYLRYRQLHLIHHNDANLTDPRLDPESYYMLPDEWNRLPGPRQWLYRVNNTLAGRMLLGPAISIMQIWPADFRAIARGDRETTRAWVLHGISVALVLWLVAGVAGMPIWQYLLLVVYPGISLSLVRSFCEHQAAATPPERTIIVEASPFWSLLFLNNNLHIAHHQRPSLPWYKIPAYYRADRERLLAENHHYLMHGYGEIFRRYFLRGKEQVPYPHLEWLGKP